MAKTNNSRVREDRTWSMNAQDTSKEIVRNRRVIIGILLYVKITNLYRDAHSAAIVNSDTLRLMGSTVKSRRKRVEKDRLPY